VAIGEKMKIVAVFTALALIVATEAFAGWVLMDTAVSMEKKTPLSDEAVDFKIGDMKCGVSATSFRRYENDSVSEYRELYCWTAKDTVVSILVNCDLPRYAMEGITIKKGEKTHMPALVCGPNGNKD
jgi:hypothetical protein